MRLVLMFQRFQIQPKVFRITYYFIALLFIPLFSCATKGEKPQTYSTSITTHTENKNDNRVILGAEQLFEPAYFSLIKNKKIGLITNHTGVLPDGRHLVDLLNENPDVDLTTLFGPEHGIRGEADNHVTNSTDTKTGVPIISLYGKLNKPTPAMLKNIDVLLFDIQDIGARFYTYIATMRRALEAAAENNVPFIVLDRPNAIGGMYVDGAIGDHKMEPVVGIDQLPITHAMTVGELAAMFNGERSKQKLKTATLTVVPMKKYSRKIWYDQTGLPWIKPSPNMLTLTTATLYPATCLLEGTNVSEGRGTMQPFEFIGAPWIDGGKLAAQLNAYQLKGVRFSSAHFTPETTVDGIEIYPPKFLGEKIPAVKIEVSNRETFESVKAGIYILHALKTLYPNNFEWRDKRLDHLLKTSEIRNELEQGKSPEEIIATWENELSYFKNIRKQYLIYN